jgi:hypothetical protein
MVVPRMRLILAVVLSVGIVVLGWMLGVAPQLETVSVARADRAVVEVQNDAHRARLVELQAQFARIDETRAELVALQKQMPTGNQLPDFVDELTAMAHAHSIDVVQYTAEEPLSPLELQAAIAPAPAEPAPATVTAAAPETPHNLFAIPVSLSLRGTDTNVRAMLADLQAAARLFFVTSATIAAEPVDSGPDASADASLSEVRGYVYVVPLSAPTAVTPPAAADEAAVSMQ